MLAPLSAAATARLILINAHLYGEERDKAVDRFRLSAGTLSRLSGHSAHRLRIDTQYRTDLKNEMADLGWFFEDCGDEFVVIDRSIKPSMVKLGSRRATEWLDETEQNDPLLFDAVEHIEEEYKRRFADRLEPDSAD